MRFCPPRAVIGFVLLLGLAALAHALTFPQLTGRVVDEANVLDAATRQALTDKLAAVEAKSGDQIVVVTLKSLQDTSIEDYGYQLGRHWGIGQKGTNTGALLIVAPNERKVRIEVGYGLEGALTDAVTRLIIQNAILPRFRANDFQGGITRGVDDIVQVVSGDAEEFKRRAAQRPDEHRERCRHPDADPDRVCPVRDLQRDARLRARRRGAQLPAQRLCWSDLHSFWRLVVLWFVRWRRILGRWRVVRRRRFFG